MAKVCSICNTENRDDAQFCKGCGPRSTPPSSRRRRRLQGQVFLPAHASGPAPSTSNTAVTPAPPKTVRDLCAGKEFIGQPLCETRECSSSVQANEALGRELKKTQERRQNYNN